MKTVKINKEKLLNKLQQNLNDHKLIYKETIEIWQTEVRLALKDALNKARSGKEFITDLDLEEPQCHIDHYKQIIEMIKWEEEDTIELDQREFNQFILDRWDWQYGFLNTANIYSSSSSSSSSSASSALITRKMSQL